MLEFVNEWVGGKFAGMNTNGTAFWAVLVLKCQSNRLFFRVDLHKKIVMNILTSRQLLDFFQPFSSQNNYQDRIPIELV